MLILNGAVCGKPSLIAEGALLRAFGKLHGIYPIREKEAADHLSLWLLNICVTSLAPFPESPPTRFHVPV